MEKLDLEIDFKDILTIENYRKIAIKNKTLGSSENIPSVKGNFIFNSKNIKSELRLKGERMIHFEKKSKSSYKIKLKGDNFILGVNSFSLQKPRVRNYIYEWLFHEMIGQEGLIKIKYEFVDFYINGSSQGLYVLEETFGKQLIERNQRRNGPIFAFDDNMINFLTRFKVDQNDPFLKVYNEKYWYQPENIDLVNVAAQKLRDFIDGNRELEETFDLELFAKFFAIMDATYTYHAISPGTLRLYYNPINGLFEPIAFDGQREQPNYHKYNSSFDNKILIDFEKAWWVKKFFFKENKINHLFYNKYLKSIKKISSKKYMNNFFKTRKKEIKQINSHIYSDYFFYTHSYSFGPGLYYFSKKDIFHRSNILKKRINSENKNIQIIKKSNNKFLVKVFFKNCLTCKKDSRILSNIIAESILCNVNNDANIYQKKITINKKLNVYKDTSISLDFFDDEYECTHMNFLDVIKKERYVKKINNLNSTYDLGKSDDYKNNNIKNFFKIKKDRIFLKEDTIIIDENLYIPKNFKVIIKPGQNIFLVNNAFIFSQSPWIAIGEKKKPITISGNKDNFGGGFIINEAFESSHFSNVKFSYLTGLKKEFYDIQNDTSYSTTTQYVDNSKDKFHEKIKRKTEKHSTKEFNIFGAINFYKTSINLENVIFERINSEDVINIINSKFSINNINFKENGSDSIDFDFSEGKIENVSFYDIGNDAIDFSGSIATINNASFFNVKDKVISVGENSEVNIKNIIATESYVGIATKDGSIVKAENITMDNVKIPFASFVKKFEYNYPKLYLKNIDVENFEKKWLVDSNSKIFYDKLPVGTISKNIISTIYNENLN